MTNQLVFFLYIIIFVIAVCNVIIQYKREKRINTFICFQAGFILYYMFIPIIIQLVIEFCPDHNKLDGFAFSISQADSYQVVYAAICTVAAYFVIMMVYSIKGLPDSCRFDTNKMNKFKNVQVDYSDKRIYRMAVVIGIVSLIIGLTAEFFIVNSFGGILKAISMGDKLRAFGTDRTSYIGQNKLFILVLMVNCLTSTYLFVFASRIHKNLSVRLLLCISVLTSAFYLMFNAGRLGVLLFVLSFLMDFVYRKTKHPVIFTCLLLVLGLFMLERLDNLFFYLSYGYLKEETTNIISILNEFAYPYLNLLNAYKINRIYGLRWGIDLVSWIVNIIPTGALKIFGLDKITSQYTFITEYYRSAAGFSGGIPTDFLTFSIRELGILGIPVMSILYTALCKHFDKAIDEAYSEKFVFMTLRVSSIMFVIIPYADLDAFIKNRYDMIILLLFLVIISKAFPKIHQADE